MDDASTFLHVVLLPAEPVLGTSHTRDTIPIKISINCDRIVWDKIRRHTWPHANIKSCQTRTLDMHEPYTCLAELKVVLTAKLWKVACKLQITWRNFKKSYHRKCHRIYQAHICLHPRRGPCFDCRPQAVKAMLCISLP